MRGGYYDDKGRWQRTKFCFVSCGDRCNCGPPGGFYYSPMHDKRLANEGDPKRAAYLRKACTCGSGLADGLCVNCWPQ